MKELSTYGIGKSRGKELVKGAIKSRLEKGDKISGIKRSPKAMEKALSTMKKQYGKYKKNRKLNSIELSLHKAKTRALDSMKKKYTGKKSEYSQSKQGNFMKIHPLDRI